MADVKVPTLMIHRAFKRCGPEPTGEEYEQTHFEMVERRELLRLNRIFRELQGHNAAPSCAAMDPGKLTDPRLRKIFYQRKQIEILKYQIFVARDYTNQRSSEKRRTKTKELIKLHDHHAVKIKKFIEQSRAFSIAVDNLVMSAMRMQIKWHSLHLANPDATYYNKKTEILEKRLFSITSKFNIVCNHNHKLRQEISIMLIFRKNFSVAQRKCRRALTEAKENFSRMSSKVFSVYDTIEASKTRIKLLVKTDLQERILLKMYMVDRSRRLDDFRKIRNFLNTKNRWRSGFTRIDSRKEKQDKKKLESYTKILMKYKHAYRVIRKSMNTYDENRFLTTCKTLDFINLALVTGNSNLTAEISSLQEQVIHLKKKNLELKYDKRDERKKHQERKNKAKVIIYSTQKLRDEALSELRGVEKYMTSLEIDMGQLYELAEGNKTAVEELLGKSNRIGPRSILPTLKAIEVRCAQLMTRRKKLQAKKDKLDGNLVLRTIFPKADKRDHKGGPYDVKIVVTGHHEMLINQEEDDKLFSQRVWTKAELKKYVRETLGKSYLDSSSDEGSNRSLMSSTRTSSTFISIV